MTFIQILNPMKKNILFLLVAFALSLSSNAQFNGIIASQDTTICLSTSADITATFDTTLRLTNSYLIQTIPHQPMPTNVGTIIPGLIDDKYYGPYQIGFNFCYFGATWTQFYVGANGWISFTPIPSSPTYDPWVTGPIPATTNGSGQAIPTNCIMGPWKDWYPGSSAGGTIKFYMTGTAPFRKLVVAWVDVSLFSCTTLHGTFQIVLHETTNIIDNHLITVPTCPTWNSGHGVQGIQNISGTVAYVVAGRNNTNWAATQESVRYVPNGNIINNFTWTDNFGVTYPAQSPLTVTPTVPTSYICKILSCGTVLSDTVTVTPEACGYLTGSKDDIECFGANTGSVTVTIHDGIGPFDFYWSNGVQTLGTNDSTQTISNLFAGAYSLTVSTLNGQYDLDTTIYVSQNPPMNVAVSSTTEACLGAEDGTVTASVTLGQLPYVYTMTGQFPISTGAPTATFTNLPTGNYTITVTDAFGCTTSGSSFVNQLVLSYSTNQTALMCHGDTNATASIEVNGGTPPYTYSWSNGGNAAGLTNLSAGTYCVTATDSKGCMVDTCVSFTEPSPVLLYASGDQTICLSQTANLVSAAVGGTPPYDFFWTPGGYITGSITVEPANSTEYCVYVVDDHGCQSNIKCASIFVHPPLDMSITVTEDTICKGDTTFLKAAISGGNGGPYFYEVLGAGAVSSPYAVNPDRTTRYIVVGSDGCGSPNVSDELYVTVLDAPIPNISAGPLKGCAPLEVNFTEHNVGNANMQYEWSFDEGQTHDISYDYNPSHIFLNDGLYAIKVKLTNSFGCSSETILPEYVEVWPSPISDFAAGTQAVSVIDPVVEFFNYSVGASTNYWVFGDGDSIYTVNPLPHEFPAVPGEYTVYLITENTLGCRDTAYMKIEVLQENGLFYAPNAFNPHSFISENRTFKPYIVGVDEQNYILRIYDRWGAVIFESTDPSIGWDGKNKSGEIIPVGSYPWIVTFKDKTGIPYTKSGNVSIIY